MIVTCRECKQIIHLRHVLLGPEPTQAQQAFAFRALGEAVSNHFAVHHPDTLQVIQAFSGMFRDLLLSARVLGSDVPALQALAKQHCEALMPSLPIGVTVEVPAVAVEKAAA